MVVNVEVIFNLYNGGVERVVDIDPYFQYSDVPSTELCSFFLIGQLYRVGWYPWSLAEYWSRGPPPILNFHHFYSSCKIPSQLSFISMSYYFCMEGVEGSWTRLYYKGKISKCRTLYLMKFSYSYMNNLPCWIYCSTAFLRFDTSGPIVAPNTQS